MADINYELNRDCIIPFTFEPIVSRVNVDIVLRINSFSKQDGLIRNIPTLAPLEV